MMEEQALGPAGPLGACAPCSNEIVIDMASFVEQLPHSIQAFVGDDKAKEVHRTFLAVHKDQGVTPESVPFLRMNIHSRSSPFSVDTYG